MSNPFPLDQSEQLPSKIEGITVFRKKPEEQAEHRPIVYFTCSNCGGHQAYSSANGTLTCTYCEHIEESSPTNGNNEKKAAVPLKSPSPSLAQDQKHEFKATTLEEARTSWAPGDIDLDCQNCGAHITLPPQKLSYECPFCNSNKVIQQKRKNDILAPQALIPFCYTVAGCMEGVRSWLGNYWLLPKALKDTANLQRFNQVFISYWAFDADVASNWEAELGKEETESYFDDGEFKTRTKTRWWWGNGRQERTVNNLLISGSHHLDKKLLYQVDTFDTDDLVEYHPDFLAGTSAQAYEVGLEEGWKEGRAQIRYAMKKKCMEDAYSQADKVRNFSMKMSMEDEEWQYILLPFILNSFSYKGKSYQLIINGQNGKLAGYRPIDWPRFTLIALLSFIPAILFFIISLVLSMAKDQILVATGVLLAIPIIALINIYVKARKIEG